jgi:thiol-disulfide isomerase/thioredoxin
LKNNIFLVIICCLIISNTNAQYKIKISAADYTRDTMIIGHYYGKNQIVKDTLFAKPKGEFLFEGKTKLDGGMYIALMKPDNSFVQFLVNETDQIFDIKFNMKDITKVTFTNSKENTLFYEYMDYLRAKGKEAEPLRDTLKKNDPANKAKLEKLNSEVKTYQKNFLEPIKGSILYHLINSNNEVDIPDFKGTDEEKQMSRYRYYKLHYFDYIDWNLPSLIRSPYIFNKVDFFMQKLTYQDPDSLILGVDFILKKLEHNKDAKQYFLSHFLNEYANGKIIGFDKVFVHIADRYYAKGEATWVTAENLKKIMESANNIRNTLIGDVFPNITTYKEDESPVVLHNVKSKYTLLIFWAPDCGHCKKVMPTVIQMTEKYKSMGLTTLTVCAKPQEKTATCWQGVKDLKMQNLLNTGDQYQRYRQFVYFVATPKVFLLDENKKILIKDFEIEHFDDVMTQTLKMEKK